MEEHPDTVHNNVFFTWNKLMILASSLEVAAIWKPGLNEWNTFLNRLRVYKECCDTSNLTVCKQQMARAVNLFKLLATPSQTRKPENLCRNPFILNSNSLESASLKPIVTPRHISKVDIPKECSFALWIIYLNVIMLYVCLSRK